MTLLTYRNWLILSIFWVGFVAVLAWMSWPRLPLDISADPATLKLFEEAKRQHVLMHAALAAAAPLLTYVIGRIACAVRAKA